MSKSKLFSDFSSFGPSVAESTHSQSISSSIGESKELLDSSSPESDTPTSDHNTLKRQRLRVRLT
jgi:hypothetical protein